MAFSDELELIDQIRHELRIEDDSGTCARVVAPERRRAKYGGLPLNFRMTTSSDEDDEGRSDFCGYEIPLLEDSIHTREIIESRLRSRTSESVDEMSLQTVRGSQMSSDVLFVTRKVEKARTTEKCSAISRFIAGHGALVDNPLLAYARFEAVGGQPSKTILVLFATSEEANDNIPRLQISVQPSAKVRDVIGYSLYRFYRDFEKVLSGDVDDYQLLMADDSGEIESDLPPLDRGRPIGDLGFTVLALVAKERSANGEEKSTYRIVVYLPNGHQFVFELENLDNTLEWLRDEALKRKRIHESIQRRDFLAEMEYELEDINVFGKALNLQQSICNSGCHEFVLVRKFSSRGEFHPRGTMFRQKSAALLTPVSRSSNNPVFDFSNALASPGETPCTPSGGVSPFMLCEDNEAVMSFRVNRIHRVKRNWAGIMSIRWDSFDIAPLASGRRSFFPNSYQKAITVPWTNLCDVKCVERASGILERPIVARVPCLQRGSSPGEASTVLAVAFLPVLEKERDLPAQEVTLRHIAQGYEGRTWKVVLVEFESEANANQAKEHILGVLRAVNPPAYQAYQRSNDGSRCPSESAEAVLMEMADGLLPATSRPPKMSTMKKLRRLRRALNSRRD